MPIILVDDVVTGTFGTLPIRLEDTTTIIVSDYKTPPRWTIVFENEAGAWEPADAHQWRPWKKAASYAYWTKGNVVGVWKAEAGEDGRREAVVFVEPSNTNVFIQPGGARRAPAPPDPGRSSPVRGRCAPRAP